MTATALSTAILPTYARQDVTFVAGEGAWLVDDEGRLVGVVPRVTLLEAMAGEAVENGNVSTPEKSQQEAQEAQKGPAHDEPAGTTEGAPA